MFIIVCASTPRSSVRVGCAGPVEALAKMRELEETGLGKVRAFDDAGVRITPEDLAARAEAVTELQSPPTRVTLMTAMIAKTLLGEDIEVDGTTFSLHDISQLAAALRPGASLTVHNASALSPIEQASITSVMPGQVRFL